PELWWDQIVLERVFHEKRDAEEKREPADPGEQFRTHKMLPVDRRFGWFGALRRFRCEELLWDWRRLWRCVGHGNRRHRWWGRVPLLAPAPPHAPPAAQARPNAGAGSATRFRGMPLALRDLERLALSCLLSPARQTAERESR